MSRAIASIGGVLAAALVTLFLAALFITAGGQAMLLSIGIVLAGLLVRATRHRRWKSLIAGTLAVAFALTAGVGLARGMVGSLHWVTVLGATVAAMACGSIVALQRLAPKSIAEDRGSSTDITIEMDVRGVDAPVRDFPARASGHMAAGIAASGIVALAVLLAMSSWLSQEAVGVGESPAVAHLDDPVDDGGPPLEAVEPSADAAIPDESLETDAGVLPGPASAPARAHRAITGHLTPSLARRECLAQVESAHLFMGFARRTSSPTTYARLTNTEIKRLASERPVGPYTLQHIAQRMWERRSEPERSAAWWSRQYARCEETRLDGGAYVVRG